MMMMMAKKDVRIQQLSCTDELSTADYSRKFNQSTSFDEACRRNRIFGARKDVYDEGTVIESTPFSDALEVLSSDKDYRFMELLSEPNYQREMCSKNFRLEKKCAGKFACHCSSRLSLGKRTTFSIGEMKKRLKHAFAGNRKELPHNRSAFGDGRNYCGIKIMNPSSPSTNPKAKQKLGKKHRFKLETESNDTDLRKRMDFSCGRIDAVLEANRLCATLMDSDAIGSASKRWTLFSSIEHGFWRVSPTRDSTLHTPNGRQRDCLSPLRTNNEVTSCDGRTKNSSTEKNSSATVNKRANDESETVETSNVLGFKTPNDNISSTRQKTAEIDLHEEEDANIIHSMLDSVSENETFTNIADEVPSIPMSVYRLDMPESSKYQEENESPVSVLDQFLAQDVNSPSSNMFQNAGDPLKRWRRLRLKECSRKPSPEDGHHYIFHHVHLVFQASSLSWDRISELRPQSGEPLDSSIFSEVESKVPDSHIDSRLLFDHVNEVLSKIQRSSFFSLTVKPSVRCLPLEEAVLDEILREADFYLIPRTEKRTLEQLVARDMAECRLWLDILPEIEHVTRHISDDLLEESILDVIHEFYN